MIFFPYTHSGEEEHGRPVWSVSIYDCTGLSVFRYPGSLFIGSLHIQTDFGTSV